MLLRFELSRHAARVRPVHASFSEWTGEEPGDPEKVRNCAIAAAGGDGKRTPSRTRFESDKSPKENPRDADKGNVRDAAVGATGLHVSYLRPRTPVLKAPSALTV